MNILFTCAGRRHYLLQFFKEVLGDSGRIIGADMQLSAPALVLADKAIAVPGVYADNYIDCLLDICKEEKVNAIISLNDLELPILAAARSRFEALGVTLIVSSDEVIDICFDKWKTFDFGKLHGFDVPKTYLTLEAVKEAINAGEVNYPLVVKPRWGSASVGIDFPDNEEELELCYKLQHLKLKSTILAQASGQDMDNAIMIQEKIQGKEFGVDILNDLNGKPHVVYVKEKLAMRAGETDKAVLREIPGLEALGFKLGEALGHVGNLDCDFFVKDGKFYLLELNPRFGGGYPFSQMAGANFPEAIISWLKGEAFDFSEFNKDYNKIFAKCDTLIAVGDN
jgi:carbamoyl-phosphate synthase large subunit